MKWLKYAALIIVSIAIVGCGKQEPTSSEDSEDTAATTTISSTTSTTTITSTTSATKTTTNTTTVVTTTAEAPVVRNYNRNSDRTYDMSVYVQGIIDNPTYPVYAEPNYDSAVLRYTGDKNRVGDFIIDGYGNFWYPLEDGSGYVVEYPIMCAYRQVCETFRNEYPKEHSFGYYRYDINNDGTEEWIFGKGDTSADQRYEVQTVEPNNFYFTYCGDLLLGKLYVDSQGNLYDKFEKMRYTTIHKVELNGANLVTTEVSQLPNGATALTEYSYYDTLGANYTDPYMNNAKSIDASTGKSIHENPAYSSPEPEYVEPITEAPTPSSDPPFNEDEPNVWCPDCGYGFFTTGVGANGLDCPNCGKNFMPAPQGQ